MLVLPWNLRAEVAAQLAGSARWGGRLVTLVPEVRIHQLIFHETALPGCFDPVLGIAWPSVDGLTISEQDRQWPLLA